ncbi:MAG: MATE family efflux transporter [Tissierellia bacterium]|nr:MATE family efflux transporter [Tissierellia bacterium]
MSKIDSNFLKKMLPIALPVTLQQLIATSLNLVDTAMISSLGETKIAAVSLVVQFNFLLVCVVIAMTASTEIFFSRDYGAKKYENLFNTTKVSLSILLTISAIFAYVSIFIPKNILSLYTKDMELIVEASSYMRYLAPSMIFFALNAVFAAGFRTGGSPNIPLKVSILSFFTNIVLNYAFIFGKLGAPKLGVSGAALGTSLSRGLEFIIFVSLSLLRKEYFIKRFKGAESKYLMSLKRFIIVAFPILLTDVFWGLAQNMYQISYANLGQQALASMLLSTTIENITYVMFRGLAAACVVLLGFELGNGFIDNATELAEKFLSLAFKAGIVIGAMLLIFPGLFLKIFRLDDPLLIGVCKNLLRIRGLILPIRFSNDILLGGILRGGADSMFVLQREGAVTWLLAVPGALIASFIFNLPVEAVYGVIAATEIIKLMLLYPRFSSGKWIRIV